jgi:hypothetical protein
MNIMGQETSYVRIPVQYSLSHSRKPTQWEVQTSDLAPRAWIFLLCSYLLFPPVPLWSRSIVVRFNMNHTYMIKEKPRSECKGCWHDTLDLLKKPRRNQLMARMEK